MPTFLHLLMHQPNNFPHAYPHAPSQEAAAGLRLAMLQHTQVKIERHVSFLATLQADRGAEAQTGHNTGLIRDK
jgi:hypothetical protein